MTAHNALWGWNGGHAAQFGEFWVNPRERRKQYDKKRYPRKKEAHGIKDQMPPETRVKIQELRRYLEEHGPTPKQAAMRAIGRNKDDPTLITSATYIIPLCEEDDGKLFIDKDARF